MSAGTQIRSRDDIDPALVRRLIAAQFPQWAELPVARVEPDGWDNRTFHLGSEMSVRLPSHSSYEAQVEKEHRWLPRLAPLLPLPIPVPIAQGVPTELYPWRWSVYRWLPGETADAGAIGDPIAFAESLVSVWDEQTREALTRLREPPVWVHGDVFATNLLVSDGRLGAVIDDRLDVLLRREPRRLPARAVTRPGDLGEGARLGPVEGADHARAAARE